MIIEYRYEKGVRHSMNDNGMYECPVCGIELRTMGARDNHDMLAHRITGRSPKKHISDSILFEL
jgi:hypothetical protein